MHVLSSTFSNLNDLIYLSRWLTLLSRHINTSELKDKSWIEIIIESFRVFNASTIWRSARNFLISIIAFSIIIIRWVIDKVERFMTCMRKYASKINKMSINSSKSIVLLIALIIICSTISLLIVDSVFRFRFSKII